jgi:flagella basal body P-ring formation protein FlgA
LVDKRLATAPPNRTASAQRARVRKASAPILAEAGKPAMLRFDGRGLRIWMRVLCLERGALGQEIRVRDPENHRVFHAEVTGVAELRAIF